MTLLFSLEGSTKLTLEFSGLAVDLLSVDSIEGHNRVSGEGFPTTGPQIEAGNVVIHRGLHVSDYWDSILMDLEVTVQYVVIIGLDVDHGVWTGKDSGTKLVCASFGSTRLMCASFGSTRLIGASSGSTRLICASSGSTRLMCASFGSTRLICASFGSTGLICAFYGTTRLLCKGTSRGRPTRGRKDA
ncbi:NAC-alpha domain-containing protein 1 [Cucumis melo var. makuwa]|uniref:NAC-alpha domain-containing protein 1 n=1 Tax=Cucumis melo var. makuwa TaxID=1194695 RepID=A0A5A7THL2_CUCMM|nr:NAC-alpha domain-containing protein 1 [Cucumis melo var. makuwa]